MRIENVFDSKNEHKIYLLFFFGLSFSFNKNNFITQV